MDYLIKTTIQVEAQTVDNLLTSAFEGGSTYWVRSVSVDEFPTGTHYASEVLTKGGNLVIYTDDGEIVHLGEANIAPALQAIADNFPTEWDNILTHNDDADTGDLFLQIACFGELVYG